MRVSHTIVYAAALARQAAAGLIGDPSAPHISPKESDPSDGVPKILVPKAADLVPSNATANITAASQEKNKTVNNTVPFPIELTRIGVLPALPANASKAALKFQPLLDFDDKSCYNAPAVDIFSNFSRGFKGLDCREKDMLKPEYNNVYVRRRCNHGWCAWMYEYYFSQDYFFKGMIGWDNKWDSVVVWTNNTFNATDPRAGKLEEWEPQYVSLSYRGRDYQTYEAKKMVFNGTHPMVGYVKVSMLPHRFSLIYPDNEEGDDGPNFTNHEPINKLGEWVKGSLVEYGGYPKDIRSALFHWLGGKQDVVSKMKMSDGALFAKFLENALPTQVWGVFNVHYDSYPKIPESQ